MKPFLVILSIALSGSVLSSAVMAQDENMTASYENKMYECQLNGMQRRVEVSYENVASPVPCSVNYYKDSELPGQVSTLWSASNTAGFCERKAAEFAEKLGSWGWECTGP